MKTKVKIFNVNVKTYFQGKGVPKHKALHNRLLLIKLDSIVKVEKEYYPQTFLKECKYEPKTTKTKNLINDYLEKSLSDEYDSESNDDSNDKTESDNAIDNEEFNEYFAEN